ncbi:FixH family protein [Uliginosibacterium sp. sgz301328]|uniref:FixH family protein n=1 Tax=Uliginosibacterium sp. sgz301328 TaxID=3243764 RepID=UPI00359E925E
MNSIRATKPWYREPWPWILMGLPATAVVAGIATLFFAIRSDDGVVADDYYQRGLAINETIARDNMARQLGLRAQLSMDPTTDQMSVELFAREGVSLPARLHVTLLHPTRQGLDQDVVLDLKNGRYVGSFKPVQSGRWDISLEDESKSWRMVQEARLPGSTKLLIQPAT